MVELNKMMGEYKINFREMKREFNRHILNKNINEIEEQTAINLL